MSLLVDLDGGEHLLIFLQLDLSLAGLEHQPHNLLSYMMIEINPQESSQYHSVGGQRREYPGRGDLLFQGLVEARAGLVPWGVEGSMARW